MRFEEYRKHDAASLAGLIAKCQVNPQEVLESAIARAEQVNPAINAIVQAREAVAVGLSEGPLRACPTLSRTSASSRPVSRRPLAAAYSRISLPITTRPM